MANVIDQNLMKSRFWETKTLEQLSPTEWEALCDRCGRCCLNKLDCEETKQIYYTDVACKLLDLKTCQCSDYSNRKKFVPDCIKLNSKTLKKARYLPNTCAYKLLAGGKKLAKWHPLISGTFESVHFAGISIRNKSILETDDIDLEDHIIDWIKPLKY